MKTVEIRLWDDLDGKAGRRVQSDEQVVLEFTSRRVRKRVTLDLTTAHAAELEDLLSRWLEAGQDPDVKVAARPHSHKAGSREARDFYAGLREWAKSVGRDGEHWTSGKGSRPRQLYYPRGLVADYQDWLMSQAEKQAG
jgi:Lsr2 protein